MVESFFNFDNLFFDDYNIEPPKTVKYVSLEKYCSHPWYEIARFPFSKEDGLHNIVAKYSILSDRSIQVVNEGLTNDNKLQSAVGNATSDDSSNSKLSVTFFWPFSGKYWIIEIGDNYEYSIVSDSNRKHLWILADSPKIDSNKVSAIKKLLVKNGFDINKLIYTKQSW